MSHLFGPRPTPRRFATGFSAAALGLVSAASLLAPLAPTPATAATPQRTPAPLTAQGRAAQAALAHPRVVWHRCAPALQCGELTVPLDYADLNQGTLVLPISRRPADRPGQRIGSLFTNPGGPGGPATQTVSAFANELGATIRARFDVVGLAPRGIEGDELAVCTAPATAQVPDAPSNFPMNATERAQWIARDRFVQQACRSTQPRILSHMSTADDARDMDVARRALGDRRITYYGVSYGTYLGATYAALFPNNVRALAVDGVIDPVAWATGRGSQASTVPVTERIRSGIGTAQAFAAVIDECERVGTTYCPEAGTFRHDWRALTARLQAGPVDMGGGMSLRYDDLIAATTGVLYSADYAAMLPSLVHDLSVQVATLDQVGIASQSSAQQAARVRSARAATRRQMAELQQLAVKARRENPLPSSTNATGAPRFQVGATAASAAPTATASPTATSTASATPSSTASATPTSTATATSSSSPTVDPTALPSDEPSYPLTIDVGFQAVLCSDTVNPKLSSTWTQADRRVAAAAGGFGQSWLWESSICAGWPSGSRRAYHGPFTRATSAPVLVVGNTNDPATPYSGAVAYHRMLKTSRLVTVRNGYGHAALGLSACVDRIRNDYLLTGKAPAKDVTCQPDHPLFTRLR